ncbi:hypothetical protein AB832_06575 [Flavobacteriaceae bacterium (ex Bugula neritina AB1)]|nr:hypothetical protein AB832_06575 [Flavobacteriaceae bacterium (ex Bugula neritina AB1)]
MAEGNNISNVLNERRSTHGNFKDNARLTIELQEIIRSHENYKNMSYSHKLSLNMILHKVSRIVCGDHNFLEHIVDIIGYAKRLEEQIESNVDKEKLY